MRNFWAIVLSLTALVTLVRGHEPICASSCLTLATNYLYSGCSTLDELYYACRCVSLEFLGSMAVCIRERCNGEGWDWLDEDICQKYGETAPISPFESVLSDSTKYVTDPPANISIELTSPIRYNEQDFINAYKTVDIFDCNMTDASFYGWLLCMMAGILCIIGAIQNHIFPLFIRRNLDIEGGNDISRSTFVAYLKKYFLLPATFGKTHIRRPWSFSIPLLSQTILIAIYIILNVVFLCVNYTVFTENLYWPADTWVQLTRYVADRSGILAFAQTPLLVAFAGRNNVLIWLTGWSYATFNVWHKWVARVCLIQTFIHSVGYSMYGWHFGGSAELAAYYEDPYLRWGAVGTVACCLLCFQAIYYFRLRWYEIFLAIHIVLAIVFIIGCWYHVALLDFGHMEWLYAAVAIWAFDRALRIGRLALLNFSWAKGRKASTAELEIAGPDAIKAVISVGYDFTFRPGQYAYCYFPRFNFWESHPFTIAAYDNSQNQPKVTVLFRTHGGVTNRLWKHLQDGLKVMSCYVEGPYGHYSPVDKYDNVLLLAGGIGVTAVFPYLRYLAQLQVNNVRFLWVVRDEDSIRWFKDEIWELPAKSNVHIEVHVTKSGTGKAESAMNRISHDLNVKRDDIETQSAQVTDKEVDACRRTFSQHILVGSKPNLQEVISNRAVEAGSLAVLACGPDTFVDDARRAVADNVTTATGVIDYFEEAFTW